MDEEQSPYHCDHDEGGELRVFTASNGARQFRLQCQRCGSQVDKTIPRDQIWTRFRIPPGQVPEWDEERRTRFREDAFEISQRRYEERRARYNAEYERTAAMRTQQRLDYMRTPKWRAVREKALRRDNYRCQGCLERQADVVHHLTYERLGNELLIDLVSLCSPCHDRAHGKERTADVSVFVGRLSASAR